MRVNGPADLPAFRLHLLDQWKPGHTFDRLVMGGGYSLLDNGDLLGNHEALTRSAAQWERDMLSKASLWWVSEEMGELLLAAARDIPEDVRLTELPIPHPAGLVVFEKPWPGMDAKTDGSGGTIKISSMLWGGLTRLPPRRGRPALEAMSIASYTSFDLSAGLEPDELKMAGPLLAMTGRYNESGPVFGVEHAPLGRSDWPLVDALGDRSFNDAGEYAMASMWEDRRVMAALWALVVQPRMVTASKRHLSRPEKRRNQRAAIEDVNPTTILTLRRLEHTQHPTGERDVQWSHRWAVIGHWRNAHVGPNGAQRKLVWVRGHVKGPDDKPLVVKQTVRAWTR